MKNNEYWEQRFTQLNEAMFNKSGAAVRDLEREYRKAEAAIQKDIEIWLRRIAANNEISLGEAKKLLKANELEEFKWTVLEYIEKGEANAIDGRWIKQLENASARVHITRYEAMLLQVRHNMEMLANTQQKSMMELNGELFSQGYYQTIYEVQKGLKQGTAFSTLKPDLITAVASKPWALDGKNFSARIWESKEKLINELQSNLAQAFIRGEAPDKTIKAISERLGASRRQAGRLVMTESAYFAAEGQRRAYGELDIEQYEIVATLDSHTSEICQELDGKVLDMKAYAPGSTAPPFHPWCRTVTCPYFDDNYTRRAARGADGEIYYVDGKMTYKEWWNSLSKADQDKMKLDLKKHRNFTRDKEQHQNYKKVLGEEMPPFEKFRDLKYNDPNTWKEMQAFYRQKNGGWLPDSMKLSLWKDNLKGYNWQAVDFAPKKINDHFKRHGADFGAASQEQYSTMAKQLLNNSVEGPIDGFITEQGYVFRYDKDTNSFAIGKPDGVIATFYKPTGGQQYWEREKKKYGF